MKVSSKQWQMNFISYLQLHEMTFLGLDQPPIFYSLPKGGEIQAIFMCYWMHFEKYSCTMG